MKFAKRFFDIQKMPKGYMNLEYLLKHCTVGSNKDAFSTFFATFFTCSFLDFYEILFNGKGISKYLRSQKNVFLDVSDSLKIHSSDFVDT